MLLDPLLDVPDCWQEHCLQGILNIPFPHLCILWFSWVPGSSAIKGDDPGWGKFGLRLHLAILPLLSILWDKGHQNRILCVFFNQRVMLWTHLCLPKHLSLSHSLGRSSLLPDNRGPVLWFQINTGFIPHWNRAEWFSELLYITWRTGRR